jgi:hypothetical protein
MNNGYAPAEASCFIPSATDWLPSGPRERQLARAHIASSLLRSIVQSPEGLRDCQRPEDAGYYSDGEAILKSASASVRAWPAVGPLVCESCHEAYDQIRNDDGPLQPHRQIAPDLAEPILVRAQ